MSATILRRCKRCRANKPLDAYPRDTSKGLAYRRFLCKACCAPNFPHLARAKFPGWMTGDRT